MTGPTNRQQTSWTKRAGTAVLTLLMAAIGLFLAAMIVPQALGYRTLIVKSGSMTGTAPVGSLVLAKPIDPEAVRLGDVILMQRSKDGRSLPPVLHRVIEAHSTEDGILVRTKGDNNPLPDPGVYSLRTGTVTPVVIVPRLGFVFSVLKSPLGWIAIVEIPAVLLAVRALWRIWKQPKADVASREVTVAF
jgi:signal peptidase